MAHTKTVQKRLNTHDAIYKWLLDKTSNRATWSTLFNTFIVLYHLTTIYTDEEYMEVLKIADELGVSLLQTDGYKLITAHNLMNKYEY